MTTTIHRRLLILTVGALAVVAAACSSTSEQVSDQISKQVGEKLELATEPTVTCPDDAEAKKGSTFQCTMTLDGKKLPLEVTFKDDTNFTSEVIGAVYKKKVLEDALIKKLADSNITVTKLSCPGTTIVVFNTDDTVDCDATDDTGTDATIKVGLDDTNSAEIQDIITT